jgi:hypothetical protein
MCNVPLMQCSALTLWVPAALVLQWCGDVKTYGLLIPCSPRVQHPPTIRHFSPQLTPHCCISPRISKFKLTFSAKTLNNIMTGCNRATMALRGLTYNHDCWFQYIWIQSNYEIHVHHSKISSLLWHICNFTTSQSISPPLKFWSTFGNWWKTTHPASWKASSSLFSSFFPFLLMLSFK